VTKYSDPDSTSARIPAITDSNTKIPVRLAANPSPGGFSGIAANSNAAVRRLTTPSAAVPAATVPDRRRDVDEIHYYRQMCDKRCASQQTGVDL